MLPNFSVSSAVMARAATFFFGAGAAASASGSASPLAALSAAILAAYGSTKVSARSSQPRKWQVNTSGSAEELVEVLKTGAEEAEIALATALEHALQALETLPASTPRKARKAARRICERVEAALEEVEGARAKQLSMCEATELLTLATLLCEVRGLAVGESGAECVEVMGTLLDELDRCCDAVVGASRLLLSTESSDRMRGLTVLRGLERVVLAQPVEAEMAAAEVLVGLVVEAQSSQRSIDEQCATWMSLFALGLRNCNEMAIVRVLCRVRMEVEACVLEVVYSGKLSGTKGMSVWCYCQATVAVFYELAQ